jgi:hypothetical protein
VVTPSKEAQMREMSMPEITRSDRSGAVRPTVMFMMGAAVGAASAWLFSRYSGPDLRQQLRSGVRSWGERIRGTLSRAGQHAPEAHTRSLSGGDQRDSLRSSVGDGGSDVLSGDLPGSVGGLSAGAMGELRDDTLGDGGQRL